MTVSPGSAHSHLSGSADGEGLRNPGFWREGVFFVPQLEEVPFSPLPTRTGEPRDPVVRRTSLTQKLPRGSRKSVSTGEGTVSRRRVRCASGAPECHRKSKSYNLQETKSRLQEPVSLTAEGKLQLLDLQAIRASLK